MRQEEQRQQTREDGMPCPQKIDVMPSPTKALNPMKDEGMPTPHKQPMPTKDEVIPDPSKGMPCPDKLER